MPAGELGQVHHSAKNEIHMYIILNIKVVVGNHVASLACGNEGLTLPPCSAVI